VPLTPLRFVRGSALPLTPLTLRARLGIAAYFASCAARQCRRWRSSRLLRFASCAARHCRLLRFASCAARQCRRWRSRL